MRLISVCIALCIAFSLLVIAVSLSNAADARRALSISADTEGSASLRLNGVNKTLVLDSGVNGTVVVNGVDLLDKLKQLQALVDWQQAAINRQQIAINKLLEAAKTFKAMSRIAAASQQVSGWQRLRFDTSEYDTIGGIYQSNIAAYFLPVAGWYSVRSGIFSPTGTTAADSAVGIGILILDSYGVPYPMKNAGGAPRYISGGQMSAAGTPGPMFSYVGCFAQNDSIAIMVFSAIPMAFVNGGHISFFQVELLQATNDCPA